MTMKVFGLCILLLKCLVVYAHTKTGGLDVRWKPATATWYGAPEGSGSDGGACGYGTLVNMRPMRARVTAVSPVLFKKGKGCGTCYKVKCLDKSMCSSRPVTVIATDECPEGGPCGNGRTHFDLSGAAFGRLAFSGQANQMRNRGELSIMYRRTTCKHRGKNITFKIGEGSSPNWFSLLVTFQDGDGDVGTLQIKEAGGTEWLEMKHLWGATYSIEIGRPLKAPFSVKMSTLTTGKTLSQSNVIPMNWNASGIYTSRLSFLP